MLLLLSANPAGAVEAGERPNIVLSEIMYQPAAGNQTDEYVEIYNRSALAINLLGWQLTNGISYSFPDITLPAGQYLAVAADIDAFHLRYPNVTSVTGPFQGRLANSGETLSLSDAKGQIIDTLTYSDEGDWAERERGPLDFNHQGWIWSDAHDGGGHSLEIINPDFSEDYGQNWHASHAPGGTPAAPNSVAATDIAPLILEPAHWPAVPNSSQEVTITARILDDHLSPITASVHYRTGDLQPFLTQVMLDDGTRGDGTAGDGIFGTRIPAQPDGTIVEFYIEAADASGNRRFFPSPTLPENRQEANLLLLVSDAYASSLADADSRDLPLYLIVMTGQENDELAQIKDVTFGEFNSNAQMNATFISVDHAVTQVRYNVGVRNRGHGSRRSLPGNYRVGFRNDAPWQGVNAINLNGLLPYSQILGSALFRKAGIEAAIAKPVLLRVNFREPAEPGEFMFGIYAAVEDIDSTFLDNHFPDDPNGEAYKCFRTDAEVRIDADLSYRGENPDDYRTNYFKQNNIEEDDWSSLIHLTDVLNNAPEENYLAAVRQVIDLAEWLDYLSLDMLLLNIESGVSQGIGDDFALYAGQSDTRFRLIPHDLDSLLLDWADVHRDIFANARIKGFQRLLSHPQIVPLYYQAFLKHIDSRFPPETFNRIVEETVGNLLPQKNLDEIKATYLKSAANARSRIQRKFTLAADLPLIDGSYRAISPDFYLFGTADAARTGSVMVNGVPATYLPKPGTWVMGQGTRTSTLIAKGANWRYLDQGSNEKAAWISADYDDSAWKEGAAPLGFGNATVVTEVNKGPVDSQYITTYFRHSFEVSNANLTTALKGHIRRDDGGVVYLNGTEVFRTNMPEGAIGYQTPASQGIAGADEQLFHEFTIAPDLLREGANILEVEIHNSVASSSDLEFDLELTATRMATTNTPQMNLLEGMNRVVVQAFDAPEGKGNEIGRGFLDIWFAPTTNAPVTDHLTMTTRDSYLPAIPFLVRIEAKDADGKINRDLWNATVTLSSSRPDILLSTPTLRLYNGMGSGLVVAEGTGDFTLKASMAGFFTSKTLVSLENIAQQTVEGDLTETITNWSGIVHVANDLTLPAGHTLVIAPGTLILMKGSSLDTRGTNINFFGSVFSEGTTESPITFTTDNMEKAWGRLAFRDAAAILAYTNLTRGGNAPRGGHTNSGAVINSISSEITLEQVNLTDSYGKAMQVTTSDLIFSGTHMARSVMGPEIDQTSLTADACWFTEMFGPNDNDGLYLHPQTSGTGITIANSVFAYGDDDGIDSQGSTLTLQNTIIRNFFNKGLSVTMGNVTADRILCVDNATGISVKTITSVTAQLSLDHATVAFNEIGIESLDKFGTGNPHIILYNVNNSILWNNTNSIRTDYDPANMQVDYSMIDQDWSGTGNLQEEPLFLDAAARNFYLAPDSPAIDAGNPFSPLDPDGSPTDLGYQSFMGAPSPPLSTTTLLLDTTYSPEQGPFFFAGDLVVEAGATLRIAPGTTLFFNPGTRMIVKGRLLAEGTSAHPIYLIGEPDKAPWGGIHFLNAENENRMTHVLIRGAVSDEGLISVNNSHLAIEQTTLEASASVRIHAENALLKVRNSTFGDLASASAEPALSGNSPHILFYVSTTSTLGNAETFATNLIAEGNSFGHLAGHNDAIRVSFDLPAFPGDLPHAFNGHIVIRDNRFLGGGDDALDIRGTDAWISGNQFTEFHALSGTANDNATAITIAGKNAFVIRNIFFDNDRALELRHLASAEFLQNTVFNTSGTAVALTSSDLTTDTENGSEVFVEGSLFAETPFEFDRQPPTTELRVSHSLVSSNSQTLGVDNITTDPLLSDPATMNFNLLPASPAIGRGPNGLDIGAMVPSGASISGEPNGSTETKVATLIIAGPGITDFRYSINGSDYGPATPVETPLVLSGLTDGEQIVAVIGKNVIGEWQEEPALARRWHIVTPLATEDLRLTEIMYNPFDPTSEENAAGFDNSDDFEFMELANAGDNWIPLAGVRFISGVSFTFPSNSTEVLTPGERAVLVNNTAAFTLRYGEGIHLLGEFEGNLSNGGERIKALDRQNRTIIDMEYQDKNGWPGRADGMGSSLELIDIHTPANSLNDPDAWRSSAEYGGSPGREGRGILREIVINEVFSNANQGQPDYIELLNPSASVVDLSGWYLSDSNRNYAKFQIPNNTLLLPGDYLVFTAAHFNQQENSNAFGLNADSGDEVYLMAADATGRLTTIVDHVDFGAAKPGEPFGRWPNASGALYPMLRPTPGSFNSGPRVGPILISEVHYNPGSAPNSDDLEFVEIINPTNAVVDLTGWRLRGGTDFDFPDATLLAPLQALVIVSFNPNDSANFARKTFFQASFSINESVLLLGGLRGNLSNGGERLTLQRVGPAPLDDPTNTPYWIEDEVEYDDAAPWPIQADGSGDSLNRRGETLFGHTAANWSAAAPTPGNVTFGEHPPQITSTPPESAFENSPYSYTIEAIANPLPAFSTSELPAWLSFNGQTLSGTPPPSEKGSRILITLIAQNSLGTDTQTFHLEVKAPQPRIGDVIINELAAARSERLLLWSESPIYIETPMSGDTNKWQAQDFDDSLWLTGPGGFGFGDGDDATNLEDLMLNITPSLYLRQAFSLNSTQINQATAIELIVDFDDGYIAYLNGQEISRSSTMGVPGQFFSHADTTLNNASHGAAVEGGTPDMITLTNISEILREGINVLAIEVHNARSTSSDMTLIADLSLFQGATSQTVVSHNSDWHYFIGSSAPSDYNPPRTPVRTKQPVVGSNLPWYEQGFDDSTWRDAPNQYTSFAGTSLYTRIQFDAPAQALTDAMSLLLNVQYKGGFIAYLNGYEVARRNLGAPGGYVFHDQFAPQQYATAGFETWPIGEVQALLKAENNILAIQLHHNTIDSAAPFVLRANLEATGSSTTLSLVPDDATWKAFIGITEPLGDTRDEDGDESDWIEITNRSTETISLAGWSLTDDPENENKWVFPDMDLTPDQYLLIYASGKNRSIAGSPLHTSFRLSSRGEYLGLFDNSHPKRLIHEFADSYPEQSPFHTWGRLGNRFGFLRPATPGTDNAGASSFLSGRAAAPTFSIPRGLYSSETTLTLSTTEPNAEIYYTTNGDEPTEARGYLYSEVLLLTKSTTLRARVFRAGYLPSEIITNSYFLGLDDTLRSLPTLSLVGDNNRTFFGPYGIATISGGERTQNGDDFWYPTHPDDFNNNLMHGKAFERPVSVEYFPLSNLEGFSEQCGIRIAGSDWIRPRNKLGDNWALNQRQKLSFRLFFDKDYGNTSLQYPLIPDIRVDSFSVLTLRAGHNDWINPFIRDEFIRNLAKDTKMLTPQGAFVNCFVNGDFRGVYNPVERPDEEYFKSWLNPEGKFDVIHNRELRSGTTEKWDELNAFLANNDFSDTANFNRLKGMIDVENYIDYLILNSWAAMVDWLQNNWGVYREQTPESVFRYYVWDAEGACGIYDRYAPDHNMFEEDILTPSTSNTISNLYIALRENKEFRTLFADRIAVHFFNSGALTDSNLLLRYRSLREKIKPMVEYLGLEYNNSIEERWIPERRAPLFEHFRQQGLWPNLNPPLLSHQGGNVTAGFQLSLNNPNTSGTIYYTTNGQDPRTLETNSQNLRIYSSPISIESGLQIRASIYNGSEWSALSEAEFSVQIIPGDIIITEIMPNPNGTDENKEWFEVFNTTDYPISLNGWIIADNALYLHTIPLNPALLVPPHGYLVLGGSSNPMLNGGIEVHYAYGTDIALGNNGGELTLFQNDQMIYSIAYGDFLSAETTITARIDITPDPGTAIGMIGNYESGSTNLWMNQTTPYGDGTNRGTPGSKNDFGHDSPDNTPPHAIKAFFFRSDRIRVLFDEILDADSAINVANYQVDNGMGVPEEVILHSPVEVELLFNQQRLPGAEHILTLTNLLDTSGNKVDLPQAIAILANHAALAITEIQYNPHTPSAAEVLAGFTDNDDFEFIELRNVTNTTLSLDGIHFSGGIQFDMTGLPPLTPGGFLVLAKNPDAFILRYPGAPTPAGPYSGSLNNGGEELNLLDANGDTLLDFSYGNSGNWPGRANGKGSSLELIDQRGAISEDYADSHFWRASSEYGGTPGSAGQGPRNDIIINEVLPHTDLPETDAIELLNRTTSTIHIGGWFLSDSTDNYFKFAITSGTVLQGGERIVFTEEDFNPSPLTPQPHHFALNGAHGDDLYLLAAVPLSRKPLQFVDSVSFLASANGEAFGRWPDGEGRLYPMTTTTLGQTNSGPRVGPLVISEFHYHPSLPAPEGNMLEFIEILNPTDQTVSIGNWLLNGGITYPFAPGEEIPSQTRILLLPFSPTADQDAEKRAAFEKFYGIEINILQTYGPYSGLLSNSGDNIQLLRPDEPPLDEPYFIPYLLEDEVRYDSTPPWPVQADGMGKSLTRKAPHLFGNDPANWTATSPTPGRSETTFLLQTDTEGNGAIQRSPNLAFYEKGTPITLSASPDPLYIFTGWTGDLTTTTNPLDITVTGDLRLTAHFLLHYARLDLMATSGTILAVPASPVYELGSEVTLTARPDTGYAFSAWAGDVPSTLTTTMPLLIHIDKDMSIEALFERIPSTYTLTVTATSGTVERSPDAEWYLENTQVQLTAIPTTNTAFAGWLGDVTPEQSQSNPLQVTMNANLHLIATFEKINRFALTLDPNIPGKITVVPDLPLFLSGSTVTLLVEPTPDHTFIAWAGDMPTSNTNPITITITRNLFISANFSTNLYSLNTNINGEGSIARTPNKAQYELGESVRLDAIAASHFTFTGWSGTGVPSGEENSNPLWIYIDSAKDISAQFTINTHHLLLTATEGGTVTSLPQKDVFNYGEAVVITATTKPDYRFVGWVGDVAPSEENTNPLTLFMTQDRSMTALFTQISTLHSYRVTYKACALSNIDTDNLTFTETSDKSSLKISLLKRVSSRMVDKPGTKYLFDVDVMPFLEFDGNFGKIYTDLEVLSLRTTGRIKSLTSRAPLSLIEAQSIRRLKIKATLPSTALSPVYAETSLQLANSAETLKATLSGIILSNLSSGQPIKSLSVTSKKYRDKASGDTYLSLGGIGPVGRVVATAWEQTATGDNLPVSTLFSPRIDKIIAKGCPIVPDAIMSSIGRLKVSAHIFSVSAGTVAPQAHLQPGRLISFQPIKTLSAKGKRFQDKTIGGIIGFPDAPSRMRVQTRNDIRTISATYGLSGIFWAGFQNDAPDYSGRIQKITLGKDAFLQGAGYVINDNTRFSPKEKADSPDFILFTR